MTRLTVHDFPPNLLARYDDYEHGRSSREAFLRDAAEIAGPGQSPDALLAALRPDYARACQVDPGDPQIVVERIRYASLQGHGVVRAYMARPAGIGPRPGVVVVHENRGLNPYIEDVTRRLAKAGYVALAPDGLSPLGGYPGDEDEGRRMQQQLDPVRLQQDFFAGVDALLGSVHTTGKVGITGFCYGGAVAHAAAVADPRLRAAVPFYGGQPEPVAVERLAVPVLLHFASMDPGVNASWSKYETVLRRAHKTYAAYHYSGTHHGFHNDTTPRYDAHAATLAWTRTLDWLRRYLS